MPVPASSGAGGRARSIVDGSGRERGGAAVDLRAWLRALHRWKWKDVRRRFTTPDGRWKPITVDGIELFNLETVPVTRYRYRGNTIPNPWTLRNHASTAGTVESPVR